MNIPGTMCRSRAVSKTRMRLSRSSNFIVPFLNFEDAILDPYVEQVVKPFVALRELQPSCRPEQSHERNPLDAGALFVSEFAIGDARLKIISDNAKPGGLGCGNKSLTLVARGICIVDDQGLAGFKTRPQ